MNKENQIESLVQRLEAYIKTTLELLRLKTTDKLSNAFSKLLSHLLLAIILSSFILFLSIGAAFYLGDLIEKIYAGFLIVSAFYGVLGIVFCMFQTKLKVKIKNIIISNFLN